MLSRIEQQQQALSAAERRVAAWVLAHPRQALDASVAEVARAAGTSDPTVIRFCRSVGLAGFRELKTRLAEALSRPASYLHRDVSADDGTGDAVAKVMDSSIQALMDMRAAASAMPFEAALQALAAARQLVFVGLGASGSVAQDAAQKFFRLGIPCPVTTDLPTILQLAAVADPRDVLLFVSHSGGWADLARAARTARARQATVIALTDPGSPLAAEATLLFECRTSEDTSLYTPMSSRLAQLALLDALQVTLALRLGEAASAHLRRSKQALAESAARALRPGPPAAPQA